MNFFKDKSNEDKLGILFFTIGLVFLLIISYIGLTRIGLWYDEIFSLGLVKLPFNEFIDLGIRDVHPLLYYFILKGFIKFFTFIDANVIGRIVSLIPFYLIAIFSFTKVRKNFGLLTAGLFTLCISSMPQLMFYGLEIRMYSWGLFFITASFIYSYEIIKESARKNWIILTILTICSAYTHYFSAVGSFSLYLMLFIYIIKNKKDLLKPWIISTIVSVLAFLPWLFIVKTQFSRISGKYWISPIGLKTIISYIYYVFSPIDTVVKGNEIVNPTILGTIFLISFISLIIFTLKRKKDLQVDYIMIGLIGFIIVPIIGISISLINTPLFHHRYMIPSLGMLWLSFSILLGKSYYKKEVFIPIIFIVLLVGIVGTVNLMHIQEIDVQKEIDTNTSFQSVISQGNIVFTDNFRYYFQLSTYIIKENHHLCWTSNIGENIKNALNDPGIQGEIDNGSKVYFVDTGESNYNECVNKGLELKKISQYTFDNNETYIIYEIKVK